MLPERARTRTRWCVLLLPSSGYQLLTEWLPIAIRVALAMAEKVALSRRRPADSACAAGPACAGGPRRGQGRCRWHAQVNRRHGPDQTRQQPGSCRQRHHADASTAAGHEQVSTWAPPLDDHTCCPHPLVTWGWQPTPTPHILVPRAQPAAALDMDPCLPCGCPLPPLPLPTLNLLHCGCAGRPSDRRTWQPFEPLPNG
jgi:hypothetical protein